MSIRRVLIYAALAFSAVAAGWPGVAAAASVEPSYHEGNPSCTVLGYAHGFKIESGFSGTHTIDPFNTVTVTSDGTYFDWTSTLGMDAVIVKGGPNANKYPYSPEATGDSGLHSPINDNTEQPYGISHIEFCYDYEVDVSKTAETAFTRTHQWSIEKSADPAHLDLFVGGTGASQYTVNVVKTGYSDSDWTVSGTITIENRTPFVATLTGVTDSLAAAECRVSQDEDVVTFPHELASGGTLTCSYSAGLPDGSERLNTATVTTSGEVGGGQATAGVVFSEPTTQVNASVQVDDSNGQSWNMTDSAELSYSRDFTCGNEAGDLPPHVNTATIAETGQSASATVRVSCYAPTVGKTAATSFNRHYDWSLDKSATQTELTLRLGQTLELGYEIAANATPRDAEFRAEGAISVTNPAPMEMNVTVADSLEGASGMTLGCGGSLTVPAGGSAECAYSADLPDNAARTNNATVTLNGIAFSASAEVVFSETPTAEIDRCATVGDTYPAEGLPAEVCADSAPKTFAYSRTIGPYSEPGCDYYVDNTASLVAGGQSLEDTVTVHICVPSEEVGCTLTQGYWRTHSAFGPAPYDATWCAAWADANTCSDGREDDPFFLSGQDYIHVLWTPPQGGNAYYTLAHQWIAAYLNGLTGASMPAEVEQAMADASALFGQYTPDMIPLLKGKVGNIARAQFITLGATLDTYNNGEVGPGHCSEEPQLPLQ